MTTADKETGLPIVGAPNAKRVPIDPKLLGDLRPVTENVLETRKIGQMVGYQLVLLLGTVAEIGPSAAMNEKNYREMLGKVAALHGLNWTQIADVDMEKGELILK